jgi:ribosomal protein S25
MGEFRPNVLLSLKYYLYHASMVVGKMVMVENVREILKINKDATSLDIANKLDIQLEVARDILKELRRV